MMTSPPFSSRFACVPTALRTVAYCRPLTTGVNFTRNTISARASASVSIFSSYSPVVQEADIFDDLFVF